MINSPDLDQACDGAAKIVNELCDREVRRLDEKARRSFLYYRGFGILVIIFSASLPFLTALRDETVQAYLIPLIAALISALSSVTVFMAYGDTWKGYRTAEIRTRYAKTKWENSIFQARLLPTIDEALKVVKDATTTFIQEVHEAGGNETQTFFQAVKDSAGQTPRS